jgi:hypothetical protein
VVHVSAKSTSSPLACLIVSRASSHFTITRKTCGELFGVACFASFCSGHGDLREYPRSPCRKDEESEAIRLIDVASKVKDRDPPETSEALLQKSASGIFDTRPMDQANQLTSRFQEEGRAASNCFEYFAVARSMLEWSAQSQRNLRHIAFEFVSFDKFSNLSEQVDDLNFSLNAGIEFCFQLSNYFRCCHDAPPLVSYGGLRPPIQSNIHNLF